MTTLVLDPKLSERLRRERELAGGDRYDEVWEGVYVMSPMPNDEHQMLVGFLTSIFNDLIGWAGLGDVRPGVNVSDREEDWEHNYRSPDVAVFLRGTQAKNHGAHWVGGPDFAIEITSPYDKTRDKLPFYARVGTREVLLLDRDPWKLELYRLQGDQLTVAGAATVGGGETVTSTVVPLAFRLIPGEARPRLEVKHTDADKQWLI